jgi:hypothetical protein
MILRESNEEIIAITQPAHAWMAGQLAREWRAPWPAGEELRLATALHDIGFLEWESQPSFNEQTGLPHTFMELPLALHLQLWSASIRSVLQFGRYPALLVSKHFTYLQGRYGRQEECELVCAFFHEQSVLEEELIESLGCCSAGALRKLENDRELLSLCDWLSLVLCVGVAEETEHLLPGPNPECEKLRVRPAPGEERFEITPWPFEREELNLVVDGKRLPRRFEDEKQLRARWADCPSKRLEFWLARGEQGDR